MTTTVSGLDLDALLRPDAVAGVLPDTTPGALAAMRYRREGPRYVQHRPNGKVWYRVRDLLEWAEGGVRDPQGDSTTGPAGKPHTAAVAGRSGRSGRVGGEATRKSGKNPFGGDVTTVTDGKTRRS